MRCRRRDVPGDARPPALDPRMDASLMAFPTHRPRRLRQNPAFRRLVAEVRLHPAELILPVFIKEGRFVRYLRTDVDDWLMGRRHDRTDHPVTAGGRRAS